MTELAQRTNEDWMRSYAKAIVNNDGGWDYAEEWWEDGRHLAEYVLRAHFRSPLTRLELPTALIMLARTVLLESSLMFEVTLDGADWLTDTTADAMLNDGAARIHELARRVAELPGAG